MAPRKAFLLRIDPELWSAIEKWAADELRSVNGQIEYLLARAVKSAGRERARSPSVAPRPPSDRPGAPDDPRGSPGDPPEAPDL